MKTITWPLPMVNPSFGAWAHTSVFVVGEEEIHSFVSGLRGWPKANVVRVFNNPEQADCTPLATQAAGTLASTVSSVTTPASLAPPAQNIPSRQISNAPAPEPIVSRPLYDESKLTVKSLGDSTVVRSTPVNWYRVCGTLGSAPASAAVGSPLPAPLFVQA